MKTIYRIPAAERVQWLAARLYEDDLNRAEGQWALTAPADVTFEPVRGMTEPTTIRARIVGIAYDPAKFSHSLVVVDERAGALTSIPLAVLVSVEPAATAVQA